MPPSTGVELSGALLTSSVLVRMVSSSVITVSSIVWLVEFSVDSTLDPMSSTFSTSNPESTSSTESSSTGLKLTEVLLVFSRLVRVFSQFLDLLYFQLMINLNPHFPLRHQNQQLLRNQ